MWAGLVCLAALVSGGRGYEPPDVRVETLKPKGIRASIPDAGNITLFVFHGNVNRPIVANTVGTLSGEILEPTDGRWIFEDRNVDLKTGDVVNYFVFITLSSGLGYLKDNQKFTVSAESTAPQTPVRAGCKPSLTTVRGRPSLCSGDVVFRDDFDSLDEGAWRVEHKIPVDHPEYPFISYQRSAVSVRDGLLRVDPRLLQETSGFSETDVLQGTLDLLDGCTGRSTAECQATARGANILPPVVAGRLTHTLVFKYGEVRIRARLPRGDWLYPELLLEPFTSRYGSIGYASGLMKIAAARGNLQLGTDNEYGNQVLYGGVIASAECRRTLLRQERRDRPWGQDYHVYSVRWTPDNITFSVDSAPWARLAGGAAALPPRCRRATWGSGTPAAPFDEEFSLSLGLAAGGVTEFPDGVSSAGRAKPWRDLASKARLHFWQERDSWRPTWDQNSALIVDYVEVVAL